MADARSRRPSIRARVTLAVVSVVLGLAAGCSRTAPPAATSGPPPELWFYETVNLAKRGTVDDVAPLWERAVRVGYRRVVLADVKFGRLGDMDSNYFARAHRLKAIADSIGLGIVPCVFQIGRSSSMLSANPNLAEGLPVKDAAFEVRGGVAHLVADPPVAFGDQPTGKDLESHVNGHTARVHGNFWHSRWWYDLKVSPNRCYHVSFWTRAVGFRGRPRVTVLGDHKQILYYGKGLSIPHDEDWTRRDLVFNSLENSKVRIYLGVVRHSRGTLDWRDWTIEEAGPVNLLRRPGAPLVVREQATGRVLVEGRDYAALVDSLMGNAPWQGQYEEWHEPPELRVSAPDGTRLRVSWEHAAIVYGKQVTCCLSEPETFDRLKDESRRMRALWGPGRYMMMFDEIRALGRDSACVKTGLSSGAILARAAERCEALLPQDTLYTWNDMFDPLHNAVPKFFLVRGDLAGAWNGLPSRVGILNWNTPHAQQSLKFFADRGHKQVLAAYYDGPVDEVRDWLAAARGIPGIEGVMYTTWEDEYGDLEAFADAYHRGPR